jgi:hypothetical protein
MPQAYPLPKKYLSILESAQGELRCVAQRARTALGEVEAEEEPYELTRVILRDIEAIAYRIALDLAQLEIAGACDGCPSAPPTTQAEAILLVTAAELERLALHARSHTERGRAFLPLSEWEEVTVPVLNGHKPGGDRKTA